MRPPQIKRYLVYFLIVNLQIAPMQSAWGQTISSVPPNIASSTAKPMLMLASSKDHTLFSPIYTDFEDIDGDDVIDTTYKPTYKYYGYFDSEKCYEYSSSNSGIFNPAAIAIIGNDGRYKCNTSQSYWSGNFLNWATMTRLDVVRKMLYGGRRSTDSTSETILERANVSQDAHSFTKFFKGTLANEIRDYTPFTEADLTKTSGDNAGVYSGLTICNRTSAQSEVGLPKMRMAKGNYRMWSTIETKVCVWANDADGAPTTSQVKLGAKLARYYGNAQSYYGGSAIKHESSLPNSNTDGASYSTLGSDLTVRIKVCDALLLGSERCQQYSPTTGVVYKPYGLLQEFGIPAPGQTAAKAEFGLITGSHDSSLNAGTLRKKMGDLQNEINTTDGRFCHSATSQSLTGVNTGACTSAPVGAIAAMDRITLYSAGNYGGAVGTAAGLEAASRPAWGNPIGEMVVEALNYYAGNNRSSRYTTASTNDTAKGIPSFFPQTDSRSTIGSANWDNPLTYTDTTRIANYGKASCRALNILALSSSALSFDQESSNAFGDLPNKTLTTLNDYTNRVGSAESINGTTRSVGVSNNTTTKYGQNCSAKSVTNLSDVSGICPEAPAIGGSYQVAGAALYGNNSRIQNLTPPIDAPTGALKVKTMAATLGGGVAKIEVPIPGSNPKKYVYIIPEGKWDNGAAGMLTFSSIESTATSGSFLVTWNDALFAGDHDMDLTGYLRYDVSGPVNGEYTIKVTSDIPNAGSGASGGTHGYSIIGVNNNTASANSTLSTDSADGTYLTHGHNRGSGAVNLAGSMCADTNYRASGTAGTYSTTTFPNHVATRAQVGGAGTVYTPCTATTGNWDVANTDLPVYGTFKMRGAENVLLKDPLWYAAKYGNYDTTAAGTFLVGNTATLPPAAWDTKRADGAACGGTTGISCSDGVPDGYFFARRPELLERQLRDQLELIVSTSNSAPAVSSSQLIEGSFKYVAQFDPTLKKGSIFAYFLNSDGNFASSASWDAGEKLQQLPAADRQVITNDGIISGTAFRWSSLSSAYTTDLKGTTATSADTRGQRLINYVRGDTANEDPNGEKFQARSISNLMGTIVNSSPWIQGRPVAQYLDYQLPSNAASYSDFATTWGNRNRVLWVGSNDGMLHGFNAESGAPVLSYVPRPLAASLRTLATPSNQITAAMDGSPFTADVLTTPNSGTATWKTYLFSSLGRGARGIFALDVTNTGIPNSTPTVASNLNEVNASSIFKWQFTATDDGDLGYVIGDTLTSPFSGQATPVIRLNNGKFGILVPNGLQSSDEKAKLIILTVDGPGTDGVWNSGTDYYKLATYAADSANGMIGATWVDINNDGTADYVYGTDLKGNVWKFDIRNSNPANWGSAFTINSSNAPFYSALDSAGTALSISTSPILSFPSRGGVMVSFGTGRSIYSNDFPSTRTNRMFGIYDRTGTTGTATFTTPAGTSTLARRTLTELTDGQLIVSNSDSLDLATNDGWYFEFVGSSESLLSNPDYRNENIAFTTVRAANTSVDQCYYTPPGRFYFLNPNTGLPSNSTLGTYVDSSGRQYSYVGVPSADQKVRVVSDRTNRSSSTTTTSTNGTCTGSNCTCVGTNCTGTGNTSCPSGTFAYRVIGKTTDYNLCLKSYNARIQWREIPGLNTRN